MTVPALKDGRPDTGDGRPRGSEPGPAGPRLAVAFPGQPNPAAGTDPAQILRLQATLLSHARFEEAAAAFATEIALVLGCEWVAIGFRLKQRSSIVATSHGAEFNAREARLKDTADAMDEAVDQAITVAVPPPAGEKTRIAIVHADLARRHGSAICTVPLAADGIAFGAITLERGAGEPFGRPAIEFIEHVACFLGPLLRMRRDGERPLPAQIADVLRAYARRAVTPGNPHFQAALWGGLVLAGVLAFVPVPYTVGAPARLEGETQRLVVAPADGYLRHAHARAGDTVRAGQLLVEFAAQDLHLESRKWESALAQHRHAYGAALARSDRAQLVIQQAKTEEAQAQLDLANEQLARSRLAAPFDGIVIKGDLSQSLGAPVKRGEVLFTIAPAQRFRLMIEVDEHDIARVSEGAHGTLALGAAPEKSWAFRVERITPVAATRDGRNFFAVEGRLEGESASLRPGLEGVAKIEAGTGAIAWIYTRRLFAWLRVTLWSWGL